MNESYDVVVLGTGAAGLVAALAAAEAGASVGLFEKADAIGGTTALSGGTTWIPVNPRQAAAGVRLPREQPGKPVQVGIDDVARLAEALAGVRRTAPRGLAEWRYHGRLVARQLDDEHLVIRADFDYRDALLRQFPGTFSVPARFDKHMMVVADLAGGEAGAIEDALEAAWQLQRSAG